MLDSLIPELKDELAKSLWNGGSTYTIPPLNEDKYAFTFNSTFIHKGMDVEEKPNPTFDEFTVSLINENKHDRKRRVLLGIILDEEQGLYYDYLLYKATGSKNYTYESLKQQYLSLNRQATEQASDEVGERMEKVLDFLYEYEKTTGIESVLEMTSYYGLFAASDEEEHRAAAAVDQEGEISFLKYTPEFIIGGNAIDITPETYQSHNFTESNNNVGVESNNDIGVQSNNDIGVQSNNDIGVQSNNDVGVQSNNNDVGAQVVKYYDRNLNEITIDADVLKKQIKYRVPNGTRFIPIKGAISTPQAALEFQEPPHIEDNDFMALEKIRNEKIESAIEYPASEMGMLDELNKKTQQRLSKLRQSLQAELKSRNSILERQSRAEKEMSNLSNEIIMRSLEDVEAYKERAEVTVATMFSCIRNIAKAEKELGLSYEFMYNYKRALPEAIVFEPKQAEVNKLKLKIGDWVSLWFADSTSEVVDIFNNTTGRKIITECIYADRLRMEAYHNLAISYNKASEEVREILNNMSWKDMNLENYQTFFVLEQASKGGKSASEAVAASLWDQVLDRCVLQKSKLNHIKLRNGRGTFQKSGKDIEFTINGDTMIANYQDSQKTYIWYVMEDDLTGGYYEIDTGDMDFVAERVGEGDARAPGSMYKVSDKLVINPQTERITFNIEDTKEFMKDEIFGAVRFFTDGEGNESSFKMAFSSYDPRTVKPENTRHYSIKDLQFANSPRASKRDIAALDVLDFGLASAIFKDEQKFAASTGTDDDNMHGVGWFNIRSADLLEFEDLFLTLDKLEEEFRYSVVPDGTSSPWATGRENISSLGEQDESTVIWPTYEWTNEYNRMRANPLLLNKQDDKLYMPGITYKPMASDQEFLDFMKENKSNLDLPHNEFKASLMAGWVIPDYKMKDFNGDVSSTLSFLEVLKALERPVQNHHVHREISSYYARVSGMDEMILDTLFKDRYLNRRPGWADDKVEWTTFGDPVVSLTRKRFEEDRGRAVGVSLIPAGRRTAVMIGAYTRSGFDNLGRRADTTDNAIDFAYPFAGGLDLDYHNNTAASGVQFLFAHQDDDWSRDGSDGVAAEPLYDLRTIHQSKAWVKSIKEIYNNNQNTSLNTNLKVLADYTSSWNRLNKSRSRVQNQQELITELKEEGKLGTKLKQARIKLQNIRRRNRSNAKDFKSFDIVAEGRGKR